MNRQMTDEEIFKKYNEAKGTREQKEQIKIIAELNSATEKEIKEILFNMGAPVPSEPKKKTTPKTQIEKIKEKNKRVLPEVVKKALTEILMIKTDEYEKVRTEQQALEKEIEAIKKYMEESE